MNWFQNKTAVVPIDFGEDSERAVNTALDTVFHPDNVHAVHVGQALPSMEPGMVWATVDDETRRTHLEKAFHDRFQDPKYHGIHFATSFGDPGHKIADYAEKIHADLIIIPSHGRTGLTRLLLGSVAERVIRLAHCDVLVLRK